jgi:hypothetical protein
MLSGVLVVGGANKYNSVIKKKRKKKRKKKKLN